MDAAEIAGLLTLSAALPLCVWLIRVVYRSQGAGAAPQVRTPPRLDALLALARSRLREIEDPGIQVFASTRLATYQTLPEDHAALVVRELLLDLERFIPAAPDTEPPEFGSATLCELADEVVSVAPRWRVAIVAFSILSETERRLTAIVGTRGAASSFARIGPLPAGWSDFASWVAQGAMLRWCNRLIEVSTLDLGTARLRTLLEQSVREVGRQIPLTALPRVLDALPADVLVAERTYASTRDALWEGLVEAQRAVHRARELATASERWATLGRLAAGVGHEINNPLSYVIQNAAMLREDLEALPEDTGASELVASAEQMTQGLIQIRRIVRDLGVFARAGQDSHKSVDIANLIDAMLTVVQGEIRNRASVVRSFEQVPAVLGDSGRLGQVMVNLLVNACEALPPDGTGNRVDVRVYPGDRGDVVIEVEDNGEGVPASLQSRIFEPFFTTKDGSGTGLGLAISREIIETHGGRLSLCSPPSGGARFRVELPAFAP